MVEFRKAIEAAKTAKEWQDRMEQTGMFAYIVPASQYPYYRRCKRILGRRKLCTYRAY
jgi:hypothetical protein